MEELSQIPSKKRSTNRKMEILRAMVGLMADPACRRITTKVLAAKLDVSEAALYRHFPSKAKMYEEILKFAESYISTLCNRITTRETKGLVQCEMFFAELMKLPASEAGLVFLLCGDALSAEDLRLRGEVERIFSVLQLSFKQMMRMAVAQEEVPAGYEEGARANMTVALLIGHWRRFVQSDARMAPVDPLIQLKILLKP